MKEMNIKEIESLTLEEVKNNALEYMEIKEHDCFLIDFGGYFGYSILVFKDGKHIYHVNDYELHHHWIVKEKGRDALREYYIREMNEKLYTDAEIGRAHV